MVLMLTMILMSSSVFAMNSKELNDIRWEYQQVLNASPTVSWYTLNSNESKYADQSVTFKAVYLRSGNGWAGFDDGNDNLMIVAVPLPYNFKQGTEYTIAATFKFMKDNANPGKSRLAYFMNEQAHLPIMSEYGL